jgi:L-ascorbate metabolism protein UlaG (beta-lactamase superfamily)
VPEAAQDRPPARVEGADIRISYVGHASLLIQTHGVNLLVDPVWSERASPVSFAGPKRVNAPGITLDDLPPLDAVLVSHNHYDHLDAAALSWLARERPAPVLTPLGNDTIMKGADAAIDARAYDWGARVEVARGVFVHFEPAYHWSARGLFDRRMALWCAFAIETPSGRIYHIADTAFADGAIFRAMREKHGAFDLAILPIGAYEPRWFMKAQHINPQEAVGIFEIVGAQRAMAHHWGTFQLTDEDIEAPPRALQAAMTQGGIAEERFRVFRPGEVFDVRRGA